MSTSTIDWDYDYFSRFVDHDPDTDTGLGVYQNCDGQFDISVVGKNIVSIEKNYFTLYKKDITWKVVMMKISLFVPH